MSQTIGAEERGLAAMTHLSGLAGYIIPGGGVIVPMKSEGAAPPLTTSGAEDALRAECP